MLSEPDVLVVGGGIAGFSAAAASARLGHATHVLTGATLGGHLISIEQIEGYPGFEEGIAGYDLCPIAQQQAVAAGAEVAMAQATAISPEDGAWFVTSPAGDYLAQALIVATGTRLRSLGVPGESEFAGRGVSHCASCDAPLLRARPVVVVGGGDSAAQEALSLAPHASRVTIVHSGANMTCQQSFTARLALDPKIECVAQSTLEAIVGNDAVSGVRIVDGSGAVSERQAAGVFVYVGLEPCSELLSNLAELSTDGHVCTDSTLASRADGIFVAGTLRAGAAGRAVAAAGEGTTAALAASRYLGGRK